MPGNTLATIYIGNLDERVDERLLYEIMVQAGPLVEIYMPRDKETKRHKGYAFAEFSSEESAQYALSLFSGLLSLYHRSLRLAISGGDKPAVFTHSMSGVDKLVPRKCGSEKQQHILEEIGPDTPDSTQENVDCYQHSWMQSPIHHRTSPSAPTSSPWNSPVIGQGLVMADRLLTSASYSQSHNHSINPTQSNQWGYCRDSAGETHSDQWGPCLVDHTVSNKWGFHLNFEDHNNTNQKCFHPNSISLNHLNQWGSGANSTDYSQLNQSVSHLNYINHKRSNQWGSRQNSLKHIQASQWGFHPNSMDHGRVPLHSRFCR